MRAHRSQPYTAACAAAGEKESGDGRARAEHEGGRGVVPVVRRQTVLSTANRYRAVLVAEVRSDYCATCRSA
eukprot:scaffold8721_cov80-Phaeocystis_antarctica.AAC.26